MSGAAPFRSVPFHSTGSQGRGPVPPYLPSGPHRPDPKEHRKRTHAPQIDGPRRPRPTDLPIPHLQLRPINKPPRLPAPLSFSPRKKPHQQEQFLRSLEGGCVLARRKPEPGAPSRSDRSGSADSSSRSAVREGIPLRFGPQTPLNPRGSRMNSTVAALCGLIGLFFGVQPALCVGVGQ